MTPPIAAEPNLPLSATQELRRATLPDGGLRGAVAGVVIGTAAVTLGLWFLVSAILAEGTWGFPTWICPLASIAFGLTYFPASLPRALAYLRFGRSRAEISPALVRPGAVFTFRFRQPVRLPIRATLTLSLVAREVIVIRTSDSEYIQHRDHLVQSFEQVNLHCAAGELLERNQEFAVPGTGAAEFISTDRQVVWLVKVRLLPRQGLDLWQEFELPCFADWASLGSESALLETEERYSVVLLKNRWPATAAFTQAVQVVAPHLTSSQVGMLAMYTPAVLVRNLIRERAEQARARLEGVGAVVEVRQNGLAIPPPQGQRYPIPHQDTVSTPASLPRPVEERRSAD